MSNIALTISNAETFDDVKKDVVKLAKLDGVGSNSREQFLARCVKGGALGSLNTLEDPNGGADHARALYALYEKTAAENDQLGVRKAHDPKTITSKSSNFRKAIAFGVQHGDRAIATVNKVITLRGEMKKSGVEGLWSPFECLNRVIVRASKSVTPLTDDEIRDAFYKEEKEKPAKDAAAHLRAALKSIEQAYKLDQSDRVTNALHAVSDAIGFIAKAEEEAELMARLAALRAA